MSAQHLPAIAALTFNGSRPAVLYLQQASHGRRRGKPRPWLAELRSVLDRAEALRFPTHRKEQTR